MTTSISAARGASSESAQARTHHEPDQVRTRQESAEVQAHVHKLAPGRSVTADIRAQLPLLESKRSHEAVTSAFIQLPVSWCNPTPADVAYEVLRAKMEGDEPSSSGEHLATYELVWLGAPHLPRNDDGSYAVFPHGDTNFDDPIAILGEEFLAKDPHSRWITTGCRAIATRGKWVAFGPSTMQGLMDFPDGADDVAFAVMVSPEDEHAVRILNCSSSPIAVACATAEIDPLPEDSRA
jgi:hypothetical protein